MITGLDNLCSDSEQHVDDSDSENFNYFNDTCTYENHKHVMIFTIEFVDSDK